jgi:2-polyprenyl-3-methyl-5-hydroxy-6-metoxy-1,4-benzoquinol methylase
MRQSNKFFKSIHRLFSSVDEDEILKFSKLSTKWADKSGEFRLLWEMNPLRINYIKSNFGRSLYRAKILDVGTGGGLLALVSGINTYGLI